MGTRLGLNATTVCSSQLPEFLDMEGGELFCLDPTYCEGERGDGRDGDASRIANEPKKNETLIAPPSLSGDGAIF